MNTNARTTEETNTNEIDILSKVKIGIEQVKQSGVSFDIELSEEEYNQYKDSLNFSSQEKVAVATPTLTDSDTINNTIVEPAPVSKSEKIEPASFTCLGGENIYSILIKELNLNTRVPRLGSRYNAIENILAGIKVSPTLYGITSGDVTKPNTGDIINLEKINTIVNETSIAEKNIIDHANSLPDIVVQGIEEYMPTDAKEALLANPVIVKSNQSDAPTILDNPNGDHTLEAGETHLLIEGDTAIELTNMTESESVLVSKSLLAEMALQSIPWTEVLSVGSERVKDFIEKVDKTFNQSQISNLINIHQVKTAVPMQANTTVLEYLQNTTLAKIRKV